LGAGAAFFMCLGQAPPGFVANNDDSEPSFLTNDTDECGVCAGGNVDNLGCGCYNSAPLTYYFDFDGDSLGDALVDSAQYCLIADDCANVDGGCIYDTVPHTVYPPTEDTCVETQNTLDTWNWTCVMAFVMVLVF
jgi:hypothetical protein